MEKQIAQWNEQFQNAKPEEVIAFFLEKFKNKIALSSSLGAEDQILTHLIASIDKNCTIFTLDTGRLFPETYELIERTNNKYKIKLKVYFPDYKEVEEMVFTKGINLFYESIENRKECCKKRKLKPLARAFEGLDAWICGLRREQSVTRADMQVVEWDKNNNLLKINPLIAWTEQEVWDYIRANHVPYHALHDKNYPSIGCQPCTMPVKQGADVRSGRWWWENPEHKECGLHAKE
jgi:phosphoadenosine phosphosulfate reductase